jgi:hypothetical protein
MPGVWDQVPGVNAAFDAHVFINDGSGMGKGPDAANRERIDQLLQRNPWFGLGKDFWLASEAQAVSTREKIEGAVAAIRQNPEAVKALVEQLKAEGALDWELPVRTEESKNAKRDKDVTKLE